LNKFDLFLNIVTECFKSCAEFVTKFKPLNLENFQLIKGKSLKIATTIGEL